MSSAFPVFTDCFLILLLHHPTHMMRLVSVRQLSHASSSCLSIQRTAAFYADLPNNDMVRLFFCLKHCFFYFLSNCFLFLFHQTTLLWTSSSPSQSSLPPLSVRRSQLPLRLTQHYQLFRRRDRRYQLSLHPARRCRLSPPNSMLPHWQNLRSRRSLLRSCIPQTKSRSPTRLVNALK
jgi:hypothetical protein